MIILIKKLLRATFKIDNFSIVENINLRERTNGSYIKQSIRFSQL